MSRLKAKHIHLLGVCVAAAVAAGLYFTLIPPATENVKAQEAAYDSLNKLAMSVGANKKALADATAARDRAQADYGAYEAQYMPLFDFANTRLSTMRYDFWPNHGKSWPERFIKAVRAFMAQQQKENGIVWLNSDVLGYPAFGDNPNMLPPYVADTGGQLVFKYPMPMDVRAPNMSRLMRHIKSWYRIRNAGVPVVENLQIAGNSPFLEAQYNVTLTIILRDKLPEVNPRIGGGQPTGGPGAAGGRPGFGAAAPGGGRRAGHGFGARHGEEK